jgi:hypothetical protein
MGIVAIPFAVDSNKVKNVFGCKDRELLEKIKTADLYDHYANHRDPTIAPKYHYNFNQFLEDIILHYTKPEDRNPRRSFFKLLSAKTDTGLNGNTNTAHGYGYVLLVICDYLGMHLLPACDGFHDTSHFKAAVDVMKENGLKTALQDMFEHHAVFDIPKTTENPAIKVFTRQEIEHINEVLDRIEVDEDKTDFEHLDFDEVQDWLKYMKESFRACKEKGLEMVTFAY